MAAFSYTGAEILERQFSFAVFRNDAQELTADQLTLGGITRTMRSPVEIETSQGMVETH
jgi:hypothetical protein